MTSLTFDELGDGIGDGWMVLRDNANRVGFEAPVPTCPGWTVRHLVAHQGMIHRWAASVVCGYDLDTDAVEREGMTVRDLLTWLDDGAKNLLQALADAPDDLEVWFFLHGAPPPKVAWARRQCHETTMHAVDARSAVLGRRPVAADTWIRPRLAVDGIDELLAGFLPRRSSRLRSATPRTVLVEATDTGDTWTLAVSEDPVVTTRDRASTPDVVLRGTAVQLYLGLWNRGDEITGDDEFLEEWRRSVTVTWS
ncbi:MAG TPA: maleylpyruvate isomerase family mycothiol-dependent enzyme [Marmoricola sp.]|nr:maleylpyruvate isomerase family mycothiol-dependent enzyme [Marmoricola sp.]